MQHPLHVYNSLTRKKEQFIPIQESHVGMYLCGPTVYGEPHLGHARSAINFDILYRYLQEVGYKVRYVRNITDVGHLENDADEGEDKIGKIAKVEQIEPMEVAQHYTNVYRDSLLKLNCMRPSIEPVASGHILEQIDVIKKIMDRGLAYEVNGSVYFDVVKYSQEGDYGLLSGRKIDELLENTRDLDGQDDKRNSVDFALWKKASPEHIMRWSSPWSEGFPGWHLECTAMSTKYLGNPFDIHAGGMDLQFPHHEAEIAQNVGCCGHAPCNYWLHNNMITINGKKMGKSLGNFITLNEFFTGDHALLDESFDGMTIRFFILQAHYRSTLDFSPEALKASRKGKDKMLEAHERLLNLSVAGAGDGNFDVDGLAKKCAEAMNDDLNTPILISHLFEACKYINQVHDGKASISEKEKNELVALFEKYMVNIMGIVADEASVDNGNDLTNELIEQLIDLRAQAKKDKNFAIADQIRDNLASLKVEIKDGKDGTTFKVG